MQEKEVKKAAQRKEEERAKWWRGAELWMELPENSRGEGGGGEEEEEEDGSEGNATKSTRAELEEVEKQQALLRRYSNDYSR
jgi:hypothetical protein